MHWAIVDKYKLSGIRMSGVLIANYHLEEDSTQVHAGTFEGLLTTIWYTVRNGKLQYDELEFGSDTFRNNQFVVTWASHKSEAVLTCNWGDHRIPFGGGLDIGAGYFSPDGVHLDYGWQTY